MRRERDGGSDTSHKREQMDASSGDQPAGGHKAQSGAGGSSGSSQGGAGGAGGAGGTGGAGGKDDASTGEQMAVDSGAMDDGNPPADAGGTAMPDNKPRWSCRPVDNGGCVCTQSDASEDSCPKPLPSCCFTSLKADQPNCECWPADSPSCRDYRNETQNPNLIGTCPPN